MTSNSRCPDVVPVYWNRSARITNLIAVLSIVSLPVGLFLYGWFFQDATATLLLLAFGVFVSGVTLIFIRKSKILRFDARPILIIGADGLDLPADKLIKWSVIRDVIVFNYEGDKLIGFRLREDISHEQRSEFQGQFGSRFYWQLFGMPVALPFTGMSLSGEELLEQLQAHGVKITAAEKAVKFGRESELM